MGTRGRRPNAADEAPLIELIMLDGGPVTPRGSAPPMTPASRPPPTRRRWWAGGAVAVVLALAVNAAVLDGGGDEDAAPATTVVPSTPTPTTVRPATTTVLPTTTASRSSGAGPVLGAAHGWTVVSFDGVRLSLLDLDTGAVEAFDYTVDRFPRATESAIMLDDRFVFTQHAGAPTVWAQRYRDEPPMVVHHDASIIVASVAGRVWVELNQAGANGELLVAEIDRDGRRLVSLTIPHGLRVVGASASGLWLNGSGRIYSLSRAGALQAVAVGTVVDASPAGVVFDDCAIAGPCTLRLAGASQSTPNAPDQLRLSHIGPSAEIRVATTNDKTDSALSPNGRWLLLADGLLDRRTAAPVSHSFVLRGWRWSPDSEWLFAWTANTGTVAWRLSDGLQLRLGNVVVSGLVTR